MTGSIELARGTLLASLPTGWQLWKLDGRGLWFRPVKGYSDAAGRVVPVYEMLGAGGRAA